MAFLRPWLDETDRDVATKGDRAARTLDLPTAADLPASRKTVLLDMTNSFYITRRREKTMIASKDSITDKRGDSEVEKTKYSGNIQLVELEHQKE